VISGDLRLDGLPAPAAAIWRLRREDIERAIAASPLSAPGPDGVPFVAWRRLGPLGVDVLHGVAQALAEGGNFEDEAEFFDGADPDLQFNASLMHFLPKGQGEDNGEGVAAFGVEGVRPLNVVNADNRLIANAARLRLEPIFDKWISADQRGFVGGRSLLANVLDVASGMMKSALMEQNAYAVSSISSPLFRASTTSSC